MLPLDRRHLRIEERAWQNIARVLRTTEVEKHQSKFNDSIRDEVNSSEPTAEFAHFPAICKLQPDYFDQISLFSRSSILS